ncbi:patatin-like phospholipase family protein [Flavobacterium terrae]|uniref:NTE family protein n=1 Tax=Flavobacterium terrae TaxID=415425 RepID=A0A1M6B5U5_9FLAO|nr:patatin-like phospholipase family protein [Flavobacterium terrae]SHI44101.1 NTE family protein [Flavobacterium terrae]
MKKSFTLVLFFFLIFSAFSQEQKKPKIGLVLSGGGAKGLAHIGALKEIEKAGIKIDYIGGTSMGAIIGGLYAAGYTANELDSIFRDVNTDALIQDNIPRKNKTFYEKYNDEVYVVTLPFQKFRVTVPKGLSKGLYNYNLLSRLTYKYRHENDFNKLKIPFLCIATNVENGKEVVFREGSLPLAITASGAFPSLFSPVEIYGSYYIDGGVTNNYPLEEVKKMGADIIIGVDVQDGLKNINQINGAAGVVVQISNFQMIERMKQKIAQTDVYIKPNIEGYSVISFEDGEAIIQKGVEAAQLVKDKLEALGTNYKTIKENRAKVDSLDIKGIGVNGLKNYTRSYVLGKLRFRPGEKISYEDLSNGMNNLNATQNFSSISYKLEKRNEAETLIINLRENPVRTYLKLALHYDDLFKSAALINVSKKNLMFKNDVASADIILGDNIRYNVDYYIDNGFHWSFGVKSSFDQFKKNSKNDFKNGMLKSKLGLDEIDIDYHQLTNQAYVQTIFFQKFLIGAGLKHEFIEINSKTAENLVPRIDRSNYLSAAGFMKFDSFTNKFFPKRGWYFLGDAQVYMYSSNYANDFKKFTLLKADIGIVETFFKTVSVKLQTEGGFVIGENVNNIFDFNLGGYGFHRFGNFKPFYGYDYLSLSGNSYVKGSASADYEFYKKNHLNFTANFSNIGNKIFDNQEWLTKPNYTGYAVGYGLETFIGPVEIKHSWSPETKKHFTWVSVGFWF